MRPHSVVTYPAILLSVLTISFLSCAQTVKPGASVLLGNRADLLAGKRVGIICNQTSRLPDGTHIVDALIRTGVNVTLLFAPEHGIRGSAAAGETVHAGTDSASGLPVRSLYGPSKNPQAEDLRGIDILLFDLQDAGARYYTYASTMALAMEAAGHAGITFVVLDRPNPVNGATVEGPVLDTALKSFVGMFPIPVRHGLTLGELALMIIGEKWLQVDVDLEVIAMDGWKREFYFDETGLPWIAPSPNLRSVEAAVAYPGTCLFEGTNVSEGRGTPLPFEQVGSPWMSGERIAARMNAEQLPGITFLPVVFTPQGHGTTIPKHAGRACGGVALKVTDRTAFRPVLSTVVLLATIQKAYPDSFRITSSFFDRLAGTRELRETIATGANPRTVSANGDHRLQSFLRARQKYLLY